MNTTGPSDACGADVAVDLPTAAELLADAVVVRVPLRVRFRGVDAREAMLLRGPFGWGEFAPFVEYPDEEAAAWLASAIEAGWQPAVPVVRSQVRVNATVPAVPAAQVPRVLAGFTGCRTVKVKVAERGQPVGDDVARVAAVRQWLGADGRIRVDANGGWTVPEAYDALSELAQFGLEYAEQPCRGVPELVALRDSLRDSGIQLAIAADESIRKAVDPFAVARAGAADVAVVKVAPLGGVRRLLRLADQLADFGMRLVVSSALDTSVGLAAGVRAAAALPHEPLDSGLGTASLLADDVLNAGLRPVGGMLPVRAIDPEPAALQRLQVDAERRQWWHDRLICCHRLLVEQGDR